MNKYNIELNLYHDCLYELQRRISVISDHLNGKIHEQYLIIEVETLCLQFRKVLEKIALMSLVANKEAYAQQNEKFAKHYHAERILNDLERINPAFYPKPIKRVRQENGIYDLVPLTEGFLTKEEFVQIYEKCGGILHAQNPFSSQKDIDMINALFPVWITKICVLLNEHIMTLTNSNIMLVAMMKRADNGLPQAVIFEQLN